MLFTDRTGVLRSHQEGGLLPRSLVSQMDTVSVSTEKRNVGDISQKKRPHLMFKKSQIIQLPY